MAERALLCGDPHLHRETATPDGAFRAVVQRNFPKTRCDLGEGVEELFKRDRRVVHCLNDGVPWRCGAPPPESLSPSLVDVTVVTNRISPSGRLTQTWPHYRMWRTPSPTSAAALVSDLDSLVCVRLDR